MTALTRPAVALLIGLALMASAARAGDFDWQKIYPDHVYWISAGYNSNLEAQPNGGLTTRNASAGRGQFWQFKAVGDNCYIVTNLLVGPNDRSPCAVKNWFSLTGHRS